jgi:3-phenylpropionate/cinnamic acid dioxygenase small subunit
VTDEHRTEGDIMADDSALTELVDKQAIIELATRYAIAVDARDWDTFRSCFVPEVVGEYTTRVVGYDEFEANAQRLIPVTRTQHTVSNFAVQLDGDRATHQCYVHAFHYTQDAVGEKTFVIRGRYTDELVRTPEGWKITFRRLEKWHLEGNPSVIPPPVSGQPLVEAPQQ